MNIFTTEHLQKVQMHFIIGSGRSGTTLLTQIFNAHTQVLSTLETKAFVNYLSYAHSQAGLAEQADKLANEIIKFDDLYRKFTQNRLKPWVFDGSVLAAYLKNTRPNYDYASFLKAFFLCFKLRNDNSNDNNSSVSFIIDKEPKNTEYAEDIMKFFPESRFIIIQRDYRAFLNSHKQSPTKRYIPEWQLLNWKSKQEVIYRLLKLYPDKMMLVNYEKLTEQPEVVIPDMCRFLQIPYEAAMIAHHKQDTLTSININSSAVNDRDKTKWGSIKKPINNSRVHKWRNELTRSEIIVAENICGKIGKLFGYMPEANASTFETMQVLIKRLPYYIIGKGVFLFFKKIYDKFPLNWRRSIKERYLLYRLKKRQRSN